MYWYISKSDDKNFGQMSARWIPITNSIRFGDIYMYNSKHALYWCICIVVRKFFCMYRVCMCVTNSFYKNCTLCSKSAEHQTFACCTDFFSGFWSKFYVKFKHTNPKRNCKVLYEGHSSSNHCHMQKCLWSHTLQIRKI